VDLKPRNEEGSLWYYVYSNLTYLVGMFNLAPLLTLCDLQMNETNDMTRWRSNCVSWGGTRILIPQASLHGYNATRCAL